MPQNLFSVGKIGLHLDAIQHRLEKGKDREIKVVELTLRAQPFSPQLAVALDDAIRGLLFKRSSGDPVDTISAVQFAHSVPKQQLLVFASSDTTEPTISFDHVAISKLRARKEKGVDGWALILHASFGPVGRQELEYVNDWYTGQRWVTFVEAEPSMEFEGAGEEKTAAGNGQRPLPTHEWEDDGTGSGKPAEEQAASNGGADDEPEPARRASRRHPTPIDAARAKQGAQA